MEYPAGDPMGHRRAAGGKVDEPLVITDTKGVKHTVANPGDKNVKNFVMDDSLQRSKSSA